VTQSTDIPYLNFQRLGQHDLPLPARKTHGAAGFDLSIGTDYVLQSQHRAIVDVGFAVEIPYGYRGVIRPRSSLALDGMDIMAGEIDSDYRGPLKVLMVNHGFSPIELKAGDRIAQLVVTPCLMAESLEVTELSETSRQDGGFGSTGA
tara:strand:- start:177 stop:620 length:444 start_codon:yes stop_codon:yes gene_type:complete